MVNAEPDPGCNIPFTDHWQVHDTGTSREYSEVTPTQAEAGPESVPATPGGGGGIESGGDEKYRE